MKIKVQWEEKDIRAGIKVRRAKTAEVWMIGYDPSCDDSSMHYALISTTDGMISSKKLNRGDMATILNGNSYLPECVWAIADSLPN